MSGDDSTLPMAGPGAASAPLSWEALADAVADVVIRTHRSGRITYASAAVRRQGYAPEELVGRLATDFVHPDDLAGLQANSAALFGAGPEPQSLNREHRFLRKDGSWVWLEGNPAILLGTDGQPLEILNVFRDVTDRRAVADELRDQGQRASMAEAVAGVGYWRLDVASQKITWSSQIFQMFGLAPGDEPALAAAMDMVHPDDKAESHARMEAALRTGDGWKDVVARIVQPGGATRYLKGRAVCERAADGSIASVFGTMVDVTDEEQAFQAIAESERRYRLLAENVTDVISMTAPDGKTLYVSPSIARMSGYTVEQALAMQMRDLVHPDDVAGFVAAYVALYRGDNAPGHPVRYRIRHADGRWIWLESRPKLALGPNGRTLKIIDVTRDVTEAQLLSEQLHGALAGAEQATAAKTEFLANMSHEIRTPLTAILGFADLLTERSDLDASAAAQLARIGGASRALLAIVNDVLDFSKLEAGQVSITPRPTCAVQAAREVLELFTLQADAKSIALHFEAASDVPDQVMIDPDRLRQILLNLVGNAVKFTDCGSVSLFLGYDLLSGILRAEVTDTGPGLSAGQRQKLFQRFSQVDASSTRTKGGTGLGLAISHGLAVAMGGDLSVSSRLGRGSTFRLELPAAWASVARDATATGSTWEILRGVRVLVVDDNANNRELARCILEGAGVEVSEAAGGLEAIHQAADLPFDLILLDLRMPVLDGRATLAAIRNSPGPNQDTPVLAFSADSVGDAQGVDGFQGYVSKPIVAAALVAAAARAMGQAVESDAESADAAAA